MASSALQPEADTVARVKKETIETAITALLKYKATQSADSKPQLFPDDDYIYLYLTLQKIPSKSRTSPFKISLPHPLLDQSSQLCLILDDRPKSPSPISEEMKKVVKSQNIPISKVLKFSKLKANYKPFEAKRKLCDSYDLFLADKRVLHLLPKLIGKEFFRKKKIPLAVDLSKKNFKLQVERALGSALLFMRTGTCCVMKVGKVSMEAEENVENVLCAISGAVDIVPKLWDGVRSLHLKFQDSVALPIYQVIPHAKLRIEDVKSEKNGKTEKLVGGEAKFKETSGRNNGKSGKKKKGRLHEVQYMDVGDAMETDAEHADGNEQVINDGYLVQKNSEGNSLVDEAIGDGNENEGDCDDYTLDQSEKKKKSKSKTKEGILSGLGGKKKAKRGDKVKVDDIVKPNDNEGFIGQKKKEGNLMEEEVNGDGNANEIDGEDSTMDQGVKKKRNKSETKEGILGGLNGKKRVRRSAKADEKEAMKSKEDGLAGREKSGGKKGVRRSAKLDEKEAVKPKEDGLAGRAKPGGKKGGKKSEELDLNPPKRSLKVKDVKLRRKLKA